MRIKLTHILALISAALFSVPAFAQTATTPFNQSSYYAASFGTWAVQSQQPNTYIFQGRSVCNFNAQNAPFFAFNTNAPVYIQDATSTNSEVVTPSAITNTAGSCGATLAPTHSHYTFQLKSGTAGLQEAINTVTGTATSPTEIILDRNFHSIANQIPGTSSSVIINAVTGNSGVYLIDITTAPNLYYSWNGTHYTPSATNQTVPTVALSTGAGTGATDTIVGNGVSGIITLTTGTTPAASATILTLTWPSIANGGFQYAPTCAVISINATHVYTTGTVATVAGPPAVATFTASATAITASTAGYQFAYKCR